MTQGKLSIVINKCVIPVNILVLSSTANTLVDYVDIPLNILYEGNIMFGADLGIVQPSGIVLEDPKLVADDGLFRPAKDSPAINAASGSYPQIVFDMDGQSRPDSLKDVGADEQSEAPVLIGPLIREDVVPVWVEDFVSSVNTGERVIPSEFFLSQNYPNPFNPATQIRFSTPHDAQVELTVFNARGQEMARLVDGFHSAGEHVINWTTTDLPSGIYFYRLEIDNRLYEVKKALLLK